MRVPIHRVAAALLASTPLFLGDLSAQSRSAGAFERAYPEASALLNVVPANLAAVYSGLQGSAAGQLPTGLHAQLLGAIERPPTRASERTGVSRRTDEVISRARGLYRQILDIYSDPSVADRRAAAEQAIDGYLQGRDPLPPEPRSSDIMGGAAGDATSMDHAAHAPEAHAGHQMDAMAPTGFAARHADVNRVLWAQQWLEIALFEPLVRPAEIGGQGAGMTEVISRFRARLSAEPADDRLSVMPTVAAISPELTMRHRRAAIILDNLHMLEIAIANELASGTAADREARLERVLANFLDPSHLAVSENDWLLESLRRSVYLQGGPALGVMDRIDRNIGSPGDHRVRGGHAIMPS